MKNIEIGKVTKNLTNNHQLKGYWLSPSSGLTQRNAKKWCCVAGCGFSLHSHQCPNTLNFSKKNNIRNYFQICHLRGVPYRQKVTWSRKNGQKNIIFL